MHLRRSLAAAALAPLLAVALAGCSGDEQADAGVSESAASSTPSAGAASAAPVGEQVDTGDFATLIADAFGKNDTADMRLQLISGGVVTEATGQIDYSGDSPRMKMTLSVPASGQGDMSTVVIDNKMYVALPNPDAKTGQEAWFELDLRDEDNPLVQQLGGLSAFDPKSSVEVFAQGLQEVVLVGNDSVGGVPTKHYVVTTTTEGVSDLGATDLEDLPEAVTYDVWLDNDGRLAKMEADFGGQGSMELTMSNWGGEVDIEAPPESRVQPYPTAAPSPAPTD